jgi:predicted Zn finger-like uncharacterized protein
LPVKFLCDLCKAKYQIPDERVAGKAVRMKCRKCEHMIEVRAAVIETSVAPSIAPPSPMDVASGQGPAPRPKPSSFPKSPRTMSSSARPAAPRPAAPRPAAPRHAAVGVDEWYASIDEGSIGPVSVDELRRRAMSGAPDP